jgi:hypothetical protein
MNRNKIFALIKSYLLNSDGLTIRQLSMLLGYDLNTSYRCARENYVLPLKEHKVLIPITDLSNYYIFNVQCRISKNGKILVETSTNKNGVSADVNG